MKQTEVAKEMIKTALTKANDKAENDYHITHGFKREAKARNDESAGRTYIRIDCYTLKGNYKGNYKCGYINNETGEYVFGQYDEVDLSI